jgi:hypothetical protein
MKGWNDHIYLYENLYYEEYFKINAGILRGIYLEYLKYSLG